MGQSAKAANDEAHRVLASAKEQRDAAMAELAKQIAEAQTIMQVATQTRAKLRAEIDELMASVPK